MKKLLVVACLIPGIAFAAASTWTATGPRSSKGACGSGTCTDAPTATEGSPLSGVQGLSVTACTDSSQTLSGAGTLVAWVYDDNAALWTRNIDLDLAVTVATGTYRCQSWAGIIIAAWRGRVMWVPNGVTTSGTTITVYINAVGKYGETL